MLGLFVQRHAEAAALYNDVNVVYVHADDKISQKFDICKDNLNDVNTIRVYYKKPKSKILSIFRFFKANRLALRQLPKPDIIHVHVLTRLGLIALWRKITFGTPYIITEHWSRYLPGNDFSGLLRKKLTKLVVKHAVAVTTVTDNLAKAMLSHGLNNKRYVVLPNVVDTNLFVPFEHSNNTTEIIHVSCFEDKSKNITGLLHSLQIMRDRGTVFHATLIGDGMDFEAMKKLSHQLHLDDYVTFSGLLEGKNLATRIAKGDFLVVSSNYENMPVVILEALSCGLPIVSTNVGGIPEIVNKNNGFLVQPHDVIQLADAMQTMIQNYKTYDTNTLRNNVLEKCSYESVGMFLDKIYKSNIY